MMVLVDYKLEIYTMKEIDKPKVTSDKLKR